MTDTPDTPANQSRPSNLLVRVGALATLLTVAGLLLAIPLASADHRALPLQVPFAAVLLGFMAAGSAPLILEVGRNGFSVSLTEIPLVIGLLGTGRGPLIVAGTAGWFLSRVFDRRMAKIKLLFNVPLTFFEMSVAIAVFDRLETNPHPTSAHTWWSLLVSLAAAITLSSSAVNVVILLTGDRLNLKQAVRHVLLAVANAALAIALTVSAVILILANPAAVVLVSLLAVLVISPLRRYATLQRRFESLQYLHEFTAGLTRSTDLTTTLVSAASQCASVLRSDSAEVILPRAGSDPLRRGFGEKVHLAPAADDDVWKRVFDQRKGVLMSRDDKRSAPYLSQHGMKDLMAVPLLHEDDVVGMLVVRDRLGDVSTFDQKDLAILSTMANQTTITLQNLSLIDQLRSEAASRQHQALHDDLTGLPNRAHLSLRIQEEIERSAGVSKFAVLLIDLNRFKDVNDTLGHHAGDTVLVEVARRLRSALPFGAFAARLGGDEFALILPGLRRIEDGMVLAQMVQRAFAEPMLVEGMALRVDASIGVSVFPDHGLDRSTLMQRADVAMYAAKAEKGAIVRLYDPSQEQSTTRQLTLVADLREAIEHGTIDVHYQPKADLTTGELVGVEALARWRHPTLGSIPPDEFIPLAEAAGLIRELTEIVLKKSLEVCAQWRTQRIHLPVAVNLDAATLREPDFGTRVEAMLAEHGLSPDLLTFEITEREVVQELVEAASRMNELRAIGVKFSIDDFGTGYSSLGYLTRLPVDEVKLDRSFVGDVADSRRHQAIIRAVADIAGSLGLRTVAEGVEDQRCWDTLRQLGCDVAQGWHLGRAMPVDELTLWCQARDAARTWAATGE